MIVIIPVLFSLALLTILIFTSLENRRNIIEDMKDRILLQTSMLSSRVDWALSSLNTMMLILQDQHGQFHTPDHTQQSHVLLRKYALSDPHIEAIFILSETGVQEFSSQRLLSIESSLGKDLVSPHITQGLESQMFVHRETGRFFLSRTLHAPESDQRQVLVLELDASQLFSLVENTQTSEMLSGMITLDHEHIISRWEKPSTIADPARVSESVLLLENHIQQNPRQQDTIIFGSTEIIEEGQFFLVESKLPHFPIEVFTVYSKSLATVHWKASFFRSLLLFSLLVLLSAGVSLLVRRRLVRTENQRLEIMDQLEDLVEERTSQLKEKTSDLEEKNADYQQALAELRSSQHYLQGIIDSSPTAIITIDRDGKVVSWSKAAEKIFGWSEQEAEGSVVPFVSSEKMEGFKRLVDQAFAGKRLKDVEIERTHRNGKKMILRLSTAPITDVDGNVVSVLSLLSDITSRKHLEYEFEHQRQVFQNLFENSPEAIVILDSQDRVTDVNAAFTQVFQYPGEEIIGSRINDLIVPEDRKEEARKLSQQAESNQVVEYETVRVKRDGTPVEVTILGYPIIVGGEQIGVFGIYRDITLQRSTERQLVQAQKMETVGRLAGGVAHDFNNMLAVILGYSELLLDKVEKDSPMHGQLEEIQEAAERSAALTRQLLAFARKQAVQPQLLDINRSLESMLSMLKRLIGENIQLIWQPGDVSKSVSIDPSQLDQILINLCVNASEAIDDVGHITIETSETELDDIYCEAHVDCSPGSYIRLTVSDDGSGMDRETMDQVFEPFFTTKPSGEGTGLGLPTIYGIVNQNGGSIHVYSERGLGTTFAVYLPAKVSGKSSTRSHAKKPVSPFKDTLILLVDDDRMVRELTNHMLGKLGYEVIMASSPQEAIEIGRTRSDFNLLLTDVIMPEMNGRDLYDTLRETHPDLQCLYMSGYTSNVIVHRGVIDEGVGFIQKPFDLSSLGMKISEVLENSR
jgi:PAS domain S-box-containing protein